MARWSGITPFWLFADRAVEEGGCGPQDRERLPPGRGAILHSFYPLPLISWMRAVTCS